MKLHRLCGVPGVGHRLAMLGAAGVLFCSSGGALATDISVWHTLNGHNKDVFEKLVKEYNRSQKDVAVSLKSFDSSQAIEASLDSAKKAGDRPQLAQLDDNRTPDELAHRKYILPLYTLLAKYPIKDAKWFLSDKNTFARDSKGRLVAFPYMAEVPVMYYNISSFKKASLQPTVPSRAWNELQAQLVTLANNGSRKCPLTSDQPVAVNLENLGAINNQLYVSNSNGLQGKGKPAFSFDVLYIRHLSMMISWVRSEIMVKPEFDSVATKRFANNECAVLMSTSGNLGWFKDTRVLDFSLTGLPYYPQVTKHPGVPFLGGSALWATDGHTKDSDAASAAFLAWLSQPKQAARWYQDTGYVPLTQQAFQSTDNSYYKNLGDWQKLVAVYAQDPGSNSRGFRIDNYPRIRVMFRQTLENALSGKEPAVTALKSAAAQASAMMNAK